MPLLPLGLNAREHSGGRAHPLTRPGDWIEIAPATLPAVQSLARGPDDSLLLSTDGGLFRFRPGRR